MVVFLRMEKMQFGGVKGEILSDMGVKMFEEFQEVMNSFQGRAGDPLNIDNNVREGGAV